MKRTLPSVLFPYWNLRYAPFLKKFAGAGDNLLSPTTHVQRRVKARQFLLGVNMELPNITSLFQTPIPASTFAQPSGQFSLFDPSDIRDPFSSFGANSPLNFNTSPLPDFGFNPLMGNSGNFMESFNQMLLRVLTGLSGLSNGNSGMGSLFGPTATNPADLRSPPSLVATAPGDLSRTTSLSSSMELPSAGNPGSYATNLEEAKLTTNPRFMPIDRGEEDERAWNARIVDQASFGRAVDEVALEYGLDPNLFRAQLQKESGAFSRDYRDAMKLVGDTDRIPQNNASLGLGQISRQFLGDDGIWRHGGPADPRVGGQPVSVEDYNNSTILQLRVAAANTAMRIEDNGGLENGLRYYVSGNPNPNQSGNDYLTGINEIMQNKDYMNIGR